MTDASPAQQLVGAVLNGRFRLVRLLGEGGMGAVFEADSLRGEGKRAVKLLHQEFVKEEQVLSRFYAEAQATRALQHPNIAQVFEAGTAEDGTPYLVMELLQGTPLTDFMPLGRAIPPQQAGPIIYAVLQALAMAHAQRIVHRDLKPDNLFLTRDARGATLVKVLDFGIAKVMDAAGGMGQKTRTGVLLGTPGYMSPEQIKNSKGVDPRSDLWSVGIILYEMLSGAQPFPADNEFARLTSVLTEEVKPIEHFVPQLAGWTPFFNRALAKDPKDRFQTAEEMARALMSMTQTGTMPQGPAVAPPTAQGQHGTMLAMPVMGPNTAPAAQMQQAPQQAYAPAASSHVVPAQASYPQAPPAGAARPGGTVASPGNTPAPYAPPQGGQHGGGVPTHISAFRPPGAAAPLAHTPQIEVIQPPPVAKGAPYWVVAVVGAVCFGLGLALGILIG
ncbi:MAG: serine/threonine-protein kinase [Byssovorax sp.]